MQRKFDVRVDVTMIPFSFERAYVSRISCLAYKRSIGFERRVGVLHKRRIRDGGGGVLSSRVLIGQTRTAITSSDSH